MLVGKPSQVFVTREAVKDRLHWCANPQQRLDDRVVRIPIVNLHREPVPLRHVDVRLERLRLRSQGLVTLGPEEVEARLADRSNPGLLGELVDHGKRSVEGSGGLVARSFIRMHGNSSQDARLLSGKGSRPPARLHVAADLHDTGDAGLGRTCQRLVVAELLAVLDLEVRVIVVDGDRERLGHRGAAAVTRAVFSLAHVLAAGHDGR